MNPKLIERLSKIARSKMVENDSSHDIHHAMRVLRIAEKIAKVEDADDEIVIPAALFHDVVCYPKNHPKRLFSSLESAEYAAETLKGLQGFPREKIEPVFHAIVTCSFTKAQKPPSLEAKILQDADSLEAMGAIAIMRTFASAGSMGRVFFDPLDPFCIERQPNDALYALDLFFTRLLIVHRRLHTETAKKMSKKRIAFLRVFLRQLKYEIKSNG